MDNYRFATKIYLGIDNIHVMRDSLNKVVDTLKVSTGSFLTFLDRFEASKMSRNVICMSI